MDWDGSPTEYVCYYPTKPLIPNPKIESKLECENLASNYLPSKKLCLLPFITYEENITCSLRTFLHEREIDV